MALSSAYRSSGRQRRSRQAYSRSGEQWSSEENNDDDDDDEVFDDDGEAPRSEHAERRQDLEEKNELRSRVPHHGRQSSTLANSRKKGRGNQSSVVRPTNGPSATQQDGSLLLDLYRDLSRIPKGMYPLFRLSYFLLKWPLLVYVVWLIASHAFMIGLDKVSQAMEPICAKPIIGSLIPFCPSSGGTLNGNVINFEKGIPSQEELGDVMESVGHNHELARAMARHEWVLRDLRIRMDASKIGHKTQLVREIDSLIQYTDDAAWAVSSFTVKVDKATNVVIAIDEDTVKKLEAIEDRQNRPPSIQQVVLSKLSPLAAFRSGETALTEAELHEVFLTTTSQIADRLKPCITDALDLHTLFKKIQLTLDRIHELAVSEKGEMPDMDILASLWNQLARADEYAEHKSHKELLEDLTKLYKGLGERTVEAISALKRMSTELKEFRDEFASARLVLRDFPLKVIMSSMRKSVERLESGRRALEQIEDGKGAGVSRGASMKQVHASAVSKSR